MKNIFAILISGLLFGCATVQYNGGQTFKKFIDVPKAGEVTTAFVGDHMVQKGYIVEEKVLVVEKLIDGGYYDIPPNEYKQIGYDEVDEFFSSSGIKESLWADPDEALAVEIGQNKTIRVISIYGGEYPYEGEFSLQKRLAARSNSFQQTLIYNGRIGNKINIGYRELSNDYARPAFNNDVEYDLSASNIIGYKGAKIEVIEADNSSITYKLLRNFM